MKTWLLAITLCSCCHSLRSMAQGKVPAPIQGTYRNIYEMLKDVPGLEVTSDNGRTGSVTVRGVNSLTRQGQPLFVLDGAVYSGDLSDLNPADIKSISVLKDAASQTAYGSRGMFGVILITSKDGKGAGKAASVSSYNGSAYSYFIEHKTMLRVYGLDDKVLTEGVIQQQQDSVLVFKQRRKELLVPIKNIKRVEMIPSEN
ncbi:TonB-dependent receptor plug domain-containing protein [Sediminibacterium soli]|uniref:TonB-dependent receptor plug domain-containing protein n=1 Tax=Sediminibacterium soli TaxID=2698829 RepID=UPI00137B0B07|nr:TonB-dependent receptor plug domain-containing protein [Sediminibacterium soli]NCI46838.1 TonB-dependent receptor plug domain-containing protein [Sediminibacterium soli]